MRLRVRVCEFAHFLSTSEARGIEWGRRLGVGWGEPGQGRRSVGSGGHPAQVGSLPSAAAPPLARS